MSYFDKPKKAPVIIHQVENGFIIEIGLAVLCGDIKTYIAKDTEVAATMVKALEIGKKQYDEAIAKWEEKEKKTAEGYEWVKKKSDGK